jgi:hypothetical protein
MCAVLGFRYAGKWRWQMRVACVNSPAILVKHHILIFHERTLHSNDRLVV